MNRWHEIGNGKIAYNLYYVGGSCDMPLLEKMTASVSNDTLYIFSNVPKHDTHKEIGIAGFGADLVMDKSEVPNYKKLVVAKR